MPPVAELLRLIAILFVVLMAPKRMAMTYARRLDIEGLCNLATNLEWLYKRRRRLRYPGESLATVAARIELIVWIADDPVGALRYMTVRERGWKRARYAKVAPPTWGAVRLWLAPVDAMDASIAYVDSS